MERNEGTQKEGKAPAKWMLKIDSEAVRDCHSSRLSPKPFIAATPLTLQYTGAAGWIVFENLNRATTSSWFTVVSSMYKCEEKS